MTSFPVVVFAYNRPKHLQKTLHSLASNRGAAQTDLYVYCDGPRSEAQIPQVEQVRNICKRITGFRSVEIVERSENLGLSTSIRRGVTELLTHHEGLIVLEDDLLTHPAYVEFMQQGLTRFAASSEVLSLSGYVPPHWKLRLPLNKVPELWLSRRNMSFGWGTWREKWKSFDWELPEKDQFSTRPDLWKEFALAGGEDLPWMLVEELQGTLDSWSIRFSYAHFRRNQFALLPGTSFIRPIGFDGSGSHCLPNPLRWLETTRHAQTNICWDQPPAASGFMNEALRQSFNRHHRWATRFGVTSTRAREIEQALR